MRASTEEALAEAKRRCEANGLKMKPAGFKYHSERTWLGIAENNDLIVVEVPVVYKEEFPEKLHVFVYSTKESRELDVRGEANKPQATSGMSRSVEGERRKKSGT